MKGPGIGFSDTIATREEQRDGRIATAARQGGRRSGQSFSSRAVTCSSQCAPSACDIDPGLWCVRAPGALHLCFHRDGSVAPSSQWHRPGMTVARHAVDAMASHHARQPILSVLARFQGAPPRFRRPSRPRRGSDGGRSVAESGNTGPPRPGLLRRFDDAVTMLVCLDPNRLRIPLFMISVSAISCLLGAPGCL